MAAAGMCTWGQPFLSSYPPLRPPLPLFAFSKTSSLSVNLYKPYFPLLSKSPKLPTIIPSSSLSGGGGYNNYGGNNNNNGKGGWSWRNSFDPDGDGWWSSSSLPPAFLAFLDKLFARSPREDSLAFSLFLLLSCFALLAVPSPTASARTVWEVRGGKWTKLPIDPEDGDDGAAADRHPNGGNGKPSLSSASPFLSGLESSWHWQQCGDMFLSLMLPEGYPHSVSSDYLEYSLWRAVQGIASQVNGVLATQSLLYAVGLGKGAIPTAAAVNWVLKDGIGYLSKILLSKFGRHFDVNPKGWRLFADLLENAAYGMEILTPAFPQYFVLIGAVAGAGRSAAALVQAATRSCFFAGFAAQRNFAEVIAKGEAQGMVSKFLGIMLGIALANCVGSSTPMALATFSAVTGIHMYCNFKSYQSIQLRTLNPYRASLVFSEYLLTGQVPPIKEVNDEEPFFPGLSFGNISTHRGSSEVLSVEAKEAASEIYHRLQLGPKLSEVVHSRDDASALFDLFRNENYMLTECRGRFCVILKEGASPQDMLQSLFHVNYLYWLEKNVEMETRSIADECKLGGRLQISLDYVQREFSHVKHDGLQSGWLTEDGLIARPLPTRIRPCFADSTKTS